MTGACTGGVTAYTWDVLNRLVRIDNPDATYAAYRYDAQGRRIGKDVNGALTRYVYDDDAILLEIDGANVLQATYSHGEEIDQPLAMTRGGQSYFYHTDHLGSVRLLTDAAGNVANSYDYDAFGNLEPTIFETVVNPYAFTARERDAESGLMFYRARYYDPRIGRFISEDPSCFDANDLNLYRYVSNRPVNFTDPGGLYAISYAYAAGTVLLVAAVIAADPDLPDPSPQLDAARRAIIDTVFAYIAYRIAPCDPPVGTGCYNKETGHFHNKWDPHYHIYDRQKIAATGQCIWKKIEGTQGGTQFPPKYLKPCSSYPSWPNG